MAATRAAGPDYARCFGHYRQMSVAYALQFCLGCPKQKACVRTTWGWDQPQRSRRGAWDRREPGTRPGRPPWPSRPEITAT